MRWLKGVCLVEEFLEFSFVLVLVKYSLFDSMYFILYLIYGHTHGQRIYDIMPYVYTPIILYILFFCLLLYANVQFYP